MINRVTIRRCAHLYILFCVAALLVAGCTESVSPNPQSTVTSGVFILNEGGFQQDNATLTLYNPKTDSVYQDYFGTSNPGSRIGDTGNDIVIANGNAYVAVTGSQTVEAFVCSTGKSLGHLQLPAGSNPREIVIVSSSSGFVSNAYSNTVTEFNPATMQKIRDISVGAAPDGIAVVNNDLFVANSTYGGFRPGPKGDSISVIDLTTGQQRAIFSTGKNPVGMQYLKSTGKLYVMNWAIYPDTMATLSEINPQSFTTERSWRLVNGQRMAFNDSTKAVYIVSTLGVLSIDLSQTSSTPVIFAPAPPSGESYNGVGVRPDNGDVYINNAKNFQVAGECSVYSKSGTKLKSFPTGLIPGNVGFY